LQPDQFTEIAFGDLHPCERLCRSRVSQNLRQALAGARGKAVVEAELHGVIESGDGVVRLVQLRVEFRDLVLGSRLQPVGRSGLESLITVDRLAILLIIS